MENVCLRRCSCRCFLKKEVPEEALLRLFQAAMQAPSARNEQPWEFILIRDPLVKEQIAQINPYYRPADGADCLLLLLADLARVRGDSPWWIQDMSACAENILLQAVESGLGAVWLGVYPREDRMFELREITCIPERVVPFAVIAVGYPANALQAVPRFEKKRIFKDKYGIEAGDQYEQQ